MWRALAPVGRSATSGGYFRQPFTPAERECADWFAAEAAARGLTLEYDGFGNVVAWWDVPGASGPAVLTGSHLDSVLDGGAYDGPLGVVSSFAAVDLLRERGFVPGRRIGIGAFVEEEGSRFGLACLGSRLAVGAVAVADAEALTDRDGVRLGDAWASAGLDPAAGSKLLADVGCFVELHVEQGRDLVHRDAAVGVASEIWPHGRYRFDFAGEANHAGTTRMEDRRDPMLTYAMTALAANKQARLAGQRATFGRIAVEPNGTNAAALVEEISRQGLARAERDGTTLAVTAESVSKSVAFSSSLAATIADPHGWPVIPTQAGHDAGILSEAGIPTAMLFVRNPTGVSHSPAEFAPMADCLAGVDALADTLERLAS